MEEIYRYPCLKQLSILMALDIAGPVAEAAAFLVRAVAASDTQADSSLQNAWFYTEWAVSGIRLLIWSLLLVTLSRLTGLRKSYGKAQVWFLLRILIVFPEVLTPALLVYRHSGADSLIQPPPSALLFTLLIIGGAVLLGESLLIPLGDYAVLHAGAELMESFGQERMAKKNRQCGNWLLGTALAFLLLLSIAFLLFLWALYTRGISLLNADSIPNAESGPLPLPVHLYFAAVLLAFLLGPASLLFRVLAAVRAGQTYRAIEELTK